MHYHFSRGKLTVDQVVGLQKSNLSSGDVLGDICVSQRLDGTHVEVLWAGTTPKSVQDQFVGLLEQVAGPQLTVAPATT